MPKRQLVKGDFIKRRALMLPEIARYDTRLKLPSGANLGNALVEAMNAIEAVYSSDEAKRRYEILYHDFGDSLMALPSDCLACRRSDLAGFSWVPALRNLARTTNGFRGLILGFMQMTPLNNG